MGGLAPHVRAAIAAAMQPRMAGAERVGARPDPPRGRGISTVPKDKSEQGETRTPCKNCSEWLELVVDGVYRIKQAKLKMSWRSGYRIGMGRISGQHLAYQLGLE